MPFYLKMPTNKYQLNDVTFKIQLYFNSYKSSNRVLSNSTKARCIYIYIYISKAFIHVLINFS